jgi:hypothetical protein
MPDQNEPPEAAARACGEVAKILAAQDKARSPGAPIQRRLK